MSKKLDPTLLRFFIFNSNYGPREGEEDKKILFYHPPAVDIDTKVKQVGLCEAVIKFSRTFTEHPCEGIHTQKTRQLFYQPETDFWMILTVSIPFSQKTKDNQPITEYHEEDVQDSVLQAVISQAYKMFKLFNGCFQSTVDRLGCAGLIQRFEHFFSNYLLTIKLSQCDILDVFNGIHFLALDKNTFLLIQCFINLLEATFTQVKYTAFLYNDHLVWSGLEQEDMRTFYRYLTTSLFPAYLEQELQGSSANTGSSGTHYGRFILGPPNMKDESQFGKIPRVHINTDSEPEECFLLVYRALSASICVFIDGSFQFNFEYFRKLDKFINLHMCPLAADIGDQYAKRPSSSGDVQYKYVYFNHMNLATKTTVHTDCKKGSSVNIPPDVLRILADLNHDLSSVTAVEDGETAVKTASDCWIVGKKSDQREFYVVLNQKNANLIEIHEEVKKMCATHFNNIFLLD